MSQEETSAGPLRSSGMKRFRLPLLSAILLLSVAACEGRGPVANDVDAVESPVAITFDSARDAEPDGAIPAALRGRWGMTPADCITTRGDNKGMLAITAERLEYYESRATPGTSIERGDNGISGNFDFVGEGQSWSKYVSLKLHNGTLVETLRNPMASYTYARCN